MKKILFMTVCIVVFLPVLLVMTVYANKSDTTEYTFDIIIAESCESPNGGNDITFSLYAYKPCQSAKAIVWMYDDSGKLLGVESKDVEPSDLNVTIHTEKDFSSAYVSVWESFSSMKPLAKKVRMGHITMSSYTVEYYKQNVERNGYNLYLAETFANVKAGSVIALDESAVPSYDGFSLDSENVSNVLSGTVTPDGLVLKVYYNHVYDDAQMVQVKYRLNKVNNVIKKYSGNFTDDEKAILKVIKSTIDVVLADADRGVLIYIEGYVSEKYHEQVAEARSKLDSLKASGGYTDFESKLTRYLSMADVEYLAKVMFGIDDIYQYEQDNM